MTGYTVHTGSTEKFSEGWDRIFSGASKPGKKQSATRSQSTKSSGKSKSAGTTASGKRKRDKS